MARVWSGLAAALLAQRGRLFPFVPICLACGIGLYFTLRFEPTIGGLATVGGTGCVLLGLFVVSRSALAPLICASALFCLGFTCAGLRAHLVAGPVLDARYYGPVTGRVIALDRSASDAVRVTLDQVWLTDLPHSRTPLRVRLSLHGTSAGAFPEAGAVVMTTAHLGPPGGAVEPGGFDFRRHAWFQRLGAVGYTRVPLVLWEPAPDRLSVFRVRMTMSDRIQTALPGVTGAFAAAIVTGDRSAIPQSVLDALRDTNLAHLLAISGLHMGLVTAFVFGALRLGLLLTPFGLRWPIKKIAAGGALIVGAGYLALSGGNVATERAFIMVAVMLLAVICDRRALSLRAVALAAVIVLVLQPDSLLGPGFQMSFAATTALVAVFGALRDSGTDLPRHRVIRAVASVVLSSAVAGAATGPYAMAHFNRMAQFGLIANLASVPLMGVLVIPAAVLAVLLMPLGLEAVGLAAMGKGLDWILLVATTIAQWSGAVRPVVTPPGAVLGLISIGALFVILWQGRARWIGVGPVLLAGALWITAERPAVLVAEGGVLVGVMTPEGRALSRATGAGFVAEVWLENDGQGLTQDTAASLWTTAATTGIRHIHGKRAARAFDGCAERDLVIFDTQVEELPHTLPCQILDATDLALTGSLALSRSEDGGWIIETARDRAGARLWNDAAVRRDQ